MASIIFTACDKPNRETPANQSRDTIQISTWAHAGQAAERKVLSNLISKFNQQNSAAIAVNFIPERSYNAQIQAAVAAGELPCILELDGPYLYNYVWQGHIEPLDNLLAKNTLDDLLPSILEQGRYENKLYGVGMFDSGLAIYTRRSILTKQGIRIPQDPADAWDHEEFEQILKTLSKTDKDGAILDLKLNYPPEWFTYAFSPMLQSAGGDLVNRKTYQSADRYLNGESSIAAMRILQSWIKQSYVDPNIDDNAFISGKALLSWAGHWEFNRYYKAFGDDLIIVPLPDFDHGTKTGQGSWLWTISQQCHNPKAAAAFLEFLLLPESVLAMSNANGAVPARQQAITKSEHYQKSAPLHLLVQQLSFGYSVPRPKTPAYPVITSVFSQAFQDIRHGADVTQVLDKAVKEIDTDIKQNRGYQSISVNSK